MSMNACPACRGPFIPHTDLCLPCGPPPVPWPRRRTLAEVSGAGAADRTQLAALLKALTLEPDDAVRAAVARDRFGLEIDATEEQKMRLIAALCATRAMCTLTDQAAPDHGAGVHWSFARPFPEKLGATVVIGVAALATGVPLVPGAALLTALYLGVRALRLVPHRLTVQCEIAERRLLVLDDTTFAEAHRALRGALDAGIRDAIRTLVDHAAEILWLFRAEGAHLHNPEIGRLDDQLVQTLRRSLVLAAGADRLMPDAKGYRGRDPGELSRRLAEVEAGLDQVWSSLRAMRGAHAHAPPEALAATRKALQEVRRGVDDANEMARPVRG